jgi:hypothetical protein
MPVAFPKDDSAEQVAKVEGVREKLVQVLVQKFLVRVVERRSPVGLLIEGQRLVGLRFRETGGEREHAVRAPLVISSIGSVPERLPGVPTRGELYDFVNQQTGELRGLSHVFGLGNVLTGQGNIKDSRDNARSVTAELLAGYLGVGPADTSSIFDGAHLRAAQQGERAAQRASARAKTPPQRIAALCESVRTRWAAVGYDGDYASWIAAHPAS